jgi:septal ring factor EnvC (AmiA/AmiB activator)
VFLGGVGLGLSVAILAVLWRVWGTTHRTEQDGRERLEMLREQQERLAHLREERGILLEELERLREQKERLRWLREGRAGLLAELKRLRGLVEEERRRDEARSRSTSSVSAEEPPIHAMEDRRNGHARVGHAPVANGHSSLVEGAKMPDKSAVPGPATHSGNTEAGKAAQSPEAQDSRSWWRRILRG